MTTQHNSATDRHNGVNIRSLILLVLMMVLMTNHSSWALQLQRLDIQNGSAKIEDMILLDARPQAQWQQNHLPGAFSLSWEDYTRTASDGVKYRTLPAHEFAPKLAAMGINPQSTLLIYGDADTSWGGEGWLAWALAWLGHQGTVYLLDGGIQAWQQAGLPVNNHTPPLVSENDCVDYQTEQTSAVNISAQELAGNAEKYTIVDTRNYWTEWLPNHIPGAIHIDWKSFHHGDQHRLIGGQQLKALLQENGVPLDKPIVYYCTGGIRSGFTWMVHSLTDLPPALNFEGGTAEWNHYQANK
jgi:thiosulfate/3-mercaptopyruvate sulfurtransferase